MDWFLSDIGLRHERVKRSFCYSCPSEGFNFIFVSFVRQIIQE